MAYADYAYYTSVYGGTVLTSDTAAGALSRASRDIDTLTFGRITASGFTTLTTFQQDIIRECTCRQADFLAQYGSTLESPLTSYGINGVSMGFDRSAVREECGVYISKSTYGVLTQTGLTYRGRLK